jgi:high affinity sulfate transporter 1
MRLPKSSTQTQAVGRWLHRFVPGISTLLNYERPNFRFDMIAGFSVAAVALPVGIAYAQIAGVPVVYGIYSSILPMLAYALFGSSRQLITGPDAATCLMVASALGPLAAGDPQRYMELMISLTLITGSFHIIFGLCRFGFVANFLSQPILVGYLNGIALIVLVGQLPKLFGYRGEADGFWGKLVEFAHKIDGTHLPTLILGGAALIALIALRRWAPRLPGALIVIVLAIIAVQMLHLHAHGVALLGAIPAGFPSLHLPSFDPSRFKTLVHDGAGIALISFTSGILTAKSFARRSRYDIDANQELIAFGACNIASGLVQGFPVTGADSRTAVNDAMGGKTRLVGIVAAVAMMFFLLFGTASLASLPIAALAAVIAVASLGLFDLASLKVLYAASRSELAFSLVTTAGVLYFDVLPGVLHAIVLTLVWMLLSASRPHDAVLGNVPSISGFHDISDYPNAVTHPGLLLYRFDGNLLFFNVDYFKERILNAVAKSPTPIEWIVVDASPINTIDITALHKLRDLREELEGRGISLGFAHVKQSLWRCFHSSWIADALQSGKAPTFATLKSAIEAFKQRE